MLENGMVYKHFIQILYDTGRTAEEKSVYPTGSGGYLPYPQKKDKQKQSRQADKMMMLAVGKKKLFLLRGNLCGCFSKWTVHLSTPPIND